MGNCVMLLVEIFTMQLVNVEIIVGFYDYKTVFIILRAIKEFKISNACPYRSTFVSYDERQ